MRLKKIKPNCHALYMNDKSIILFSYQVPVAYYDSYENYYRTSKKFSRTTSGHINSWLGGLSAKETDQLWFDNLPPL